MPHPRTSVLATLAVAALLAALLPAGSRLSGSVLVAGRPAPRLAGCPVFPSNNYWNRDISRLPVHRRSAQWLSHMSPGRKLHPDFGPSYGDGPDYGIPVTFVRSSHPRVDPTFTYADESDRRGGYPFGRDTRIEGGRDSGGDMHAVVVDRDACRLYETWNTTEAEGRWSCRVGCDLVAEVQPAPTGRLDLVRCSGSAHPPRAAALG